MGWQRLQRPSDLAGDHAAAREGFAYVHAAWLNADTLARSVAY